MNDLRSFDRVYVAASTALALVAPAEAVDLGDRLSLEGVLAAAGQCQEADPASSGVCKGAVPLQVEARFRATESDEFAVKLGFAAGNGLNIDHTQIAELYYRFAANDQIALTGDVQYMDDRYRARDGPRGWVFGVRATAEF